MGRVSEYPVEFRREAVRLVLDTDATTAQVARDLGLNRKTLGNWVRAERKGIGPGAEPGPIETAEREELRRLRQEVRELRAEREILRKATAYFARETTR